jgi:hypothetical protein
MDGGNAENVEVSKNGEAKQILQTFDIVTNISLDNHTVKISLFEPRRNLVYQNKIPNEAFGYKVVLESTATYDQWYHRFDSTRDLH